MPPLLLKKLTPPPMLAAAGSVTNAWTAAFSASQRVTVVEPMMKLPMDDERSMIMNRSTGIASVSTDTPVHAMPASTLVSKGKPLQAAVGITPVPALPAVPEPELPDVPEPLAPLEPLPLEPLVPLPLAAEEPAEPAVDVLPAVLPLPPLGPPVPLPAAPELSEVLLLQAQKINPSAALSKLLRMRVRVVGVMMF